MSFDQMPPEMLTIILSDGDIPLQQSIALRRVSSQWLEIIEKHLKKQTKLAIYPNQNERHSKTDLVVRDVHFTAEFVQQITRLFPALADLTLKTVSEASYQQLSALLATYRTTLTTLSLTGKTGRKKRFPATQRLTTALNGLTRLTSLQLDGYFIFPQLLRRMAPTLARLERFSYKPGRVSKPRHFGRVLFTHLTDRCTHLELKSHYLNWNRGTQLGTSLTSLTADLVNNHWQHICDEFTALRTLRLNHLRLDNDNLDRLSRLQHLTELELTNISLRRIDLTEPPPTSRPLVNVERLTVQLAHVLHDGAVIRRFYANLRAWFPGLEQLTFTCRPEDYPIFNDTVGGGLVAGNPIRVEMIR